MVFGRCVRHDQVFAGPGLAKRVSILQFRVNTGPADSLEVKDPLSVMFAGKSEDTTQHLPDVLQAAGSICRHISCPLEFGYFLGVRMIRATNDHVFPVLIWMGISGRPIYTTSQTIHRKMELTIGDWRSPD